MIRIRIYVILTVALSSIQAYAEVNSGDYATKRYSEIPPSPEVSSMMKYIDIPVSHFTGQPQIDIPVYTILSSK